MQNFTLLKASAGSGKTFRLARKYLEFACTNPYYYRHILAVTFTNKATAELKKRILSELNLIASGEKSDHASYLQDKLKVSEKKLAQLTHKVLANILQDFSNFHIYTIDGFFQGILKGFFREIGINTQFNIELSQNQVLEKATDLLFFELAESNNEDLIQWLTHFSESEVEEGNTWNLKNKIKKLGQELFSEQYKAHTTTNENLSEVLADIAELRKDLLIKNKTFWDTILVQCQTITRSVENNGFGIGDFKGKSRSVLGHIQKIQKEKSGYKYEGKLANYVDNSDAVAPKGKAGVLLLAYYDQTLNEQLKQLQGTLEQGYAEVTSNKLILKNLYSLGVIKYVQAAIKKINAEQNTILISDSNELIQKITHGSDAPFIYEKSGNKFWNYMIDEFQDTSRMQWNNLKPLIDNSLAYNKENLIVGDVKQSIYRWRNSDWKMLGGDIREEYIRQVNEENLPANYRSKNNIISFNNTFFDKAKQILVNEWQTEDAEYGKLIEKAYENSFQDFGKQNEGGFVIGKELEAAVVDDFYDKAILELAKQIDELLDKGYTQSDLVILVRKNTEGESIIQKTGVHIKHQNVSFVSEDSYFLQSSFIIQFVISALRFLQNGTPLLKNQVYYLYSHYLVDPSMQKKSSILTNKLNYIAGIIASRSLVNLVHEIILQFDIMRFTSQEVFVLAFLDEISAFQERNQGGLEEFLRYWETNGEKLVVKDAQNKESIRILTIHKSKGLEFNVVLLPFLNWDIYPAAAISPILWCKNSMSSSQHLKALPIKYEKDMAITPFKSEYFNEKVQSVVDNINLVYVAFTRAVEGLIFYTMKKPSPKKAVGGISNISKLVQHVCSSDVINAKESGYVSIHEFFNEEEGVLAYGEMASENTIEQTKMAELLYSDLRIHKAMQNIKVRQNIKSRIKKYQEDKDIQSEISPAKMGILLHRVFENLNSLSELPKQMRLLVQDGWIKEEQCKVIENSVEELITSGVGEDWFRDDVEVLKETEIITAQGDILRPDRVVRLNDQIIVIDFKFGKEKNAKYKRQIREYVKVVESIYSEQVKGVIWYILLGKIDVI